MSKRSSETSQPSTSEATEPKRRRSLEIEIINELKTEPKMDLSKYFVN
jgi:hypothetical protein